MYALIVATTGWLPDRSSSVTTIETSPAFVDGAKYVKSSRVHPDTTPKVPEFAMIAPLPGVTV